MKLRLTVLTFAMLVSVVAMQPAAAQQGWNPAMPVSYNLPVADQHMSHAGGGTQCGCLACSSGRIWTDFEYLMWWGKGRSVPPMVTSSPPGTPQAQAGVLGQAGTTILFGGPVGESTAGGGRVSVGTWLSDSSAIGARFFGLEGNSDGFFAASTGNPILARPFFNVQSAAQDAQLVAFPAIVTGDVTVRTDSDILGTEAFMRMTVDWGQGYSVDVIGGYHFTRVDDFVVSGANTTSIDAGGAVPVGTTLNFLDQFGAKNEFHGAEFGVIADFHRGCWDLSALGKISFGNMRQTVTINGVTEVTVPGGGTASSPGGLYSMPSNIGTFSRDRTAIVPELSMTLGYRFDQCMKMTFGYNFIYWSEVALAGDQIDTSINLTQAGGAPLVGAARPAFAFASTDYWLHGLTMGVELSY